MKEKLSWLKLVVPAIILSSVIGTAAMVLEPSLEEIPEKLELVVEETPKVETTAEPVTVKKKEKKEKAKLQKVSYKKSKNGYKDGTYYGSATGYGGAIKVQVEIKDGKITSVQIVSATQETPSFLEKAKAVTGKIVEAQSPNVDAVSGATYTSNGIMNATVGALNQAGAKNLTVKDNTKKETVTQNEKKKKVTKKKKNNSKENIENGTWKSGTYYGSGEGYGGTIEVKVVIRKKKIATIQIVSAKYETPEYFVKAKEILKTIKKKQTTEVDAISGATYSTEGIKEAIGNALSKAVEKTEEKTNSETKDTNHTENQEKDSNNKEEEMVVVSTTPSNNPENTIEPTVIPTGNPDGATTVLEDGSVCVEVAVPYEEQYVGTAVCYPDDSEDFLEYSIQLLLNVKGTRITRTITKDGQETVEQENIYEVTQLSFSEETIKESTEDGNWFYLKRASEGFGSKVGVFQQLLQNMKATKIDAISGATCSSDAVWEAYKSGLAQIK